MAGAVKSKRPTRHMTNIEFITELMKWGNPMKQIFIIDAIGKFAKKVAETPIEELREQFGENSFISADGWQIVAKEINTAMNTRETDPQFRIYVDEDDDDKERARRMPLR